MVVQAVNIFKFTYNDLEILDFLRRCGGAATVSQVGMRNLVMEAGDFIEPPRRLHVRLGELVREGYLLQMSFPRGCFTSTMSKDGLSYPRQVYLMSNKGWEKLGHVGKLLNESKISDALQRTEIVRQMAGYGWICTARQDGFLFNDVAGREIICFISKAKIPDPILKKILNYAEIVRPGSHPPFVIAMLNSEKSYQLLSRKIESENGKIGPFPSSAFLVSRKIELVEGLMSPPVVFGGWLGEMACN
jgi:hypothetical protein